MELNLVRRFEILELHKSSTHSENTNASHSQSFSATWTGVLEFDAQVVHNQTVILSLSSGQSFPTLYTLQESQEEANNTLGPVTSVYLYVVYLEITTENIQKWNVIVLS